MHLTGSVIVEEGSRVPLNMHGLGSWEVGKLGSSAVVQLKVARGGGKSAPILVDFVQTEEEMVREHGTQFGS